ncbi:hypothetical protein CDD83_9250 [Cordyceps sp. RAO-2017]|nr:hypothetical protein CDD83_9250 [Cordyceps sp. RAO-2017]
MRASGSAESASSGSRTLGLPSSPSRRAADRDEAIAAEAIEEAAAAADAEKRSADESAAMRGYGGTGITKKGLFDDSSDRGGRGGDGDVEVGVEGQQQQQRKRLRLLAFWSSPSSPRASSSAEETTAAAAAAAASSDGNSDEVVTAAEDRDLRRGLAERHVSMMGIAGAIGTGLFLGLGAAVRRAGPLGALLGYGTVGLVV